LSKKKSKQKKKDPTHSSGIGSILTRSLWLLTMPSPRGAWTALAPLRLMSSFYLDVLSRGLLFLKAIIIGFLIKTNHFQVVLNFTRITVSK
jgi:hypothetical protein